MWMELIMAIFGAGILAYLLSVALRWRAPARKNSHTKAWLGFFLPTILVVWSAGILMTPTGQTRWATIWLPFSVLALAAAVLMATVASPKKPSRREEREIDRTGEPLDPVFMLYMFGMTVALITAAVTRGLWA